MNAVIMIRIPFSFHAWFISINQIFIRMSCHYIITHDKTYHTVVEAIQNYMRNVKLNISTWYWPRVGKLKPIQC